MKLITAVFAVIILCAVVTKAPEIHAQQAPVPVIINPAPKQYRVIDLGVIPAANGRTLAGSLEVILNEMGLQGWKLVTTTGNLVIMMQ